jgi:RNA-directed DNA polymerase
MEVSTKQLQIAELAAARPEESLTSLNQYLDMDWMKEAYRRTRRESAAGVDGQTMEEYGRELESNLQKLIGLAKSGRYQAPPVRRVHIPKGDGKETRPIGIPTTEDKVLQRAITMLLEPIYEQEFMEFSFGFRPGRSAHDGLEYLWKQCMDNQVRWILDVDIRSYFDTLDHAKLREIVSQRVQDGVVRRLIGKWLKAGVMEAGALSYREQGTPQGGVISPILSNIYLHEVLDKWFVHEVKVRLKGRAFLVRYADDFVMGFESEEDAQRVYAVLPKRFGKYGLNLHPTKTRLIPFARPCPGQESSEGTAEQENSTFDFLGLTHYWGKTRKGGYAVKRQTARKRLSRSLKAINQWMQSHLHLPLRDQWEKLTQKLQGHFAYYGITGNSEALERFRKAVKRLWHKWLNRRSRQDGGMPWQRFEELIERYFPLPPAKVVHSIYAAKS